MSCKTLYISCLEFCIPRFENYSREKRHESCKWLEDLERDFSLPTAAPVIEDMLNHAFYLANNQNKSFNKIWRKEWIIFFTKKITSAVLAWDSELLNHVGCVCTNLKQCEVVVVKTFSAELVLKLPKSVTVLDFNGDLINRGKMTNVLQFQNTNEESWLPQAEKILKALQIFRATPVQHSTQPNTFSLTELNLGNIQASASDLKIILKSAPNLLLLRHYQMVTALYELHCDTWRKKGALPKYKLKNIDVDFSHVVRCRMSPEWVLSPDALQLAVVLCPSANSLRIRFDCSTPHDVLTPVLDLPKVKEFSAVCVSSGERTLLDFSDMIPFFEKFGPVSLNFLELKVIEEVEIHVIIEYCTKVETLVLSGCGYVTPPSCSSFNCQTYRKGSFRKLQTLFYADGDDFSWDHGVPECFWRATLCSSGKSRHVKLQGLFLEFPRISESLIQEIFYSGQTLIKAPFPELKVVSFCRFEEITINDIAALCGIFQNGNANPCETLRYIRLSDCEKIQESDEKKLKILLKLHNMKHVKIDVDSQQPKRLGGLKGSNADKGSRSRRMQVGC